MRLSDFLRDVGQALAYYPAIARLVGIKEAIFLCQLIYWTGKQSNEEGWIYKTTEELSAETGMSYHEQRRARGELSKLGLLQERLQRLEHKKFYRIDLDRLNELWESRVVKSPPCESATREHAKAQTASDGKRNSSKGTNSTTENITGTPAKDDFFRKADIPFPSDELPPPLNTPEMRDDWDEWQEHYRLRKKTPLTKVSARSLVKKLQAMGLERARAAIRHSIDNNWPSIFEPKEDWKAKSKRAVRSLKDTPDEELM